MDENIGRFCGCHPDTIREKDVVLSNGAILNEGMTIDGVVCRHRRYIPKMGWQSFCSRMDRIEQGCENE